MYVHMYVYLFTSIFIRTGLLMIGGRQMEERVGHGWHVLGRAAHYYNQFSSNADKMTVKCSLHIHLMPLC